MRFYYSIAVMAATLLYMGGCSTHQAPSLPKSPDFMHGERDGCATAHGTYTKESPLFQNSPEYREGWFSGRRECNPAYHRK